MESAALVGKTIQDVRTFTCERFHPAWVDELTTSIATSAAFLQMADGLLVRVDPCELESPSGGYPSLGLTLDRCEVSALRLTLGGGRSVIAQPLSAASAILPLTVLRAEESDPLQEGGLSEIRLIGPDGTALLLRHIMPPMTLGIEIRRAPHAPQESPAHTREP